MIKLLRPINLFIIVLTMCLVRYCIMQTQLHLQVLALMMEDTEFIILCVSVVLIAAAGYIINDILDVNTDMVNRPDAPLVTGRVNKTKAMNLYLLLNLLGLGMGLYVASHNGGYQLAIVHLLSIGLLWIYSYMLKGVAIVGNLVIAILSAIVVFVPLFFDPSRGFLNSEFKVGHYVVLGPNLFVVGYCLFAFLTSLMREIVKDAEDVEGDRAAGYRTLAVIAGVNTAKYVAVFIGLLVVVFIGVVQHMQIKTNDTASFLYFTIFIQLPLIVLLFLTVKAKTKKQFHLASTLNKVVMLTGVLSMLVFWLTLRP